MDTNYAAQLSTLSKRAQDCAKPDESKNPIWDVLSDLWHPRDNPGGYVSIGVAENTLMHADLEDHIRQNIKVPQQAFTYGDGPRGSKRLRRAVARFLNRRLHPATSLEMEHVIVTNGVTDAIEHVSWAFANPGDGFLLGQPYYGAFIPDISLRPGVEVLQVQFGAVDPMSVDAVRSYEAALVAARRRGVETKALMLCSPHNPLGRCYSREAILAYMRLCQKYRIHLVSDEIYAFSTWENRRDAQPPPVDFVSVLSIALDGVIDPSLVHVLWGMSKDFGANGIRIGCIISQHNAAFRQALVDVALYSSSSSVSEHIAANILEDDVWVDRYITTNQMRLADSYSFVVDFLNKHRIPYTPGAHAAFFLWVDLGRAYADRHRGKHVGNDITDVVTRLLLMKRVFLASGAHFGSERPGIYRVVFSHPREFLEEALNRMVEAIGHDVHEGMAKARM